MSLCVRVSTGEEIEIKHEQSGEVLRVRPNQKRQATVYLSFDGPRTFEITRKNLVDNSPSNCNDLGNTK